MAAKKRPGYGVAMWDREKYPLLVTLTDEFFKGGFSCNIIDKNPKAKWPAYKNQDNDGDPDAGYTIMIKDSGSTWYVNYEHIVLAQRDKPTIVIMSKAVA